MHRYKIFTSNLALVKFAIEYFLSQVSGNEKRFNEIKRIAAEQTFDPSAKVLASLGYFSLTDFVIYNTHTKEFKGDTNTQVIEMLLDAMAEEKLLNELPNRVGRDRRFKASGDFAKFFYDRDLVLNAICGWRYIIEKYSNSVVKIEHKDSNSDFSIGTGFYYAAGNSDFVKYLIITNKHVLEGASQIRLLLNDDNEIPFSEIILDEKNDLGYIILDGPLETPIFQFNPTLELISEILTIGYPSIPMTKHAYQVYHKGEINSFVEDYGGNKLFLFSAKTSSGNSGSPIIDRHGTVIGIVTEELFEKEHFFQKGKLPYYAGIPTQEIINSLNKYVF